jgi:hypothetical protein
LYSEKPPQIWNFRSRLMPDLGLRLLAHKTRINLKPALNAHTNLKQALSNRLRSIYLLT